MTSWVVVNKSSSDSIHDSDQGHWDLSHCLSDVIRHDPYLQQTSIGARCYLKITNVDGHHYS
jgi:hypothetical protein